MAYITGQTVHGCSTPAKYLGGNTYECAPDVGEFYKKHRIYNDYHMWYAKVTGEVGETVTVRLKWPQFDPDAVSAEYRAWATYSADWPSFFYALHEVLYISTDELTWEHIDGARVEGDTVVFTVTLTTGTAYLSATLHYTEALYKALRSELSASPYAETICLGKGWGGADILTFAVTDPSVPNEGKKTVYYQGLQHCHESTGGHVCDYMLRYLISDAPKARELRRRFIFRITPVVDVGGWKHGHQTHPAREGSIDFNFNRDWGVFEVPEVRAIAKYLDTLKANGEDLVMLADLHGATGDENDYSSGASCFADDLGEDIVIRERLDRQSVFGDMVVAECDYLNPSGKLGFWIRKAKPDGQFAMYAQKVWGPAYTFEISMSKIWDRAAGRRFPNSQAAYRRFAEQLLSVIGRFFLKD